MWNKPITDFTNAEPVDPNQLPLPLQSSDAPSHAPAPPKRYGEAAMGTLDEYGPEIHSIVPPIPPPTPHRKRPPLTPFSRLRTEFPFKNMPARLPQRLKRWTW